MLRHSLLLSGPIAALLLAACGGGSNAEPQPRSLLAATPGSLRFQEPALVPVPGGLLNAAGGNLLVRRVDLAIDTKLGTWEIGAVYNSKTRRWLWSFDTHYNGAIFVDPSGALHEDIWYLANDALVPGSVWIKVDGSKLRSTGGLVHDFDATGRLAAVHWASSPYPRLEHLAQTIAGALRTTEIRQCGAPGACAPVAWIGYDAGGNVTSIVDRAGRVADFGYDAQGWLVVARDALDVERSLPGTRYEYREDQRLFAMTSSEGERLEYAWHWNQGRITEVRRSGDEGFAHRFEYAVDADPTAPHLCTHVDPLGQRTQYRFDGQRRLRRVTLPTGEVSTRDWSGREMARLALPGGATTTWQHVGADEVVRTDPSGNVVHLRFRITAAEDRSAPFRRPIEAIEDSLGVLERRGYDGSGRLVWIENGAGERTRFEWSPENLLATQTGPDGIAITTSSYGEHGHAEHVGIGGEAATRVFDGVGNLVAISGLERLDLRPGGELRRRFDADRNLAELVLAGPGPAGAAGEASVRTEWRSDRRPLRIERPGGGDHEFEYDAQGRLRARRERSGGVLATTLYEVDALGRSRAETLPNGMRRERSWDASGRAAGLSALRDGALEGELAVQWADDRPVAAVDSRAGGVESYEWDASGALAAIDFPGGERLEIARDLRGRRVLETYRQADGSVLREIGFGYDAAGRQVRMTEGGALLVEETWSQGRLAATFFGSGVLRGLMYDATTGALAGATSVRADGAVVEASALSLERRDGAGELRLVAETTSAGPAAATTREEFALGPLGGAGKRLVAWGDGTSERGSVADALANTLALGDTHFQYDAESSRLVARVDATTGEPLGSYAYDEAGFCISRDGTALAWTALGRIASIGSDADFDWDLQGRPLRRRVASEEVRFAFGGRVETDAAGVPLRLDLGAVVLQLDTGERRYRHLDFRANVKLESDDAGAVTLHRAYAPYGARASIGADDGAAGFAGGREVAGLVMIGERLLDPAAGRFLSPDPVLQTVNQYAYTLANPVAFWDPDGRQWQASGFFYGAGAGAGAAAIGGATSAAAGGAAIGTVVGGPIGALLGLAIAEALYQQLNPGSHGPFSLADALEAVTPFYVAPPERGGNGCGCGDRSSGGPRGAPAADPGAPAGNGPSGPGISIPSFRFGAWGAGTSAGAVGGGFGGW
jgi:RHS repeat-associated protein